MDGRAVGSGHACNGPPYEPEKQMEPSVSPPSRDCARTPDTCKLALRTPANLPNVITEPRARERERSPNLCTREADSPSAPSKEQMGSPKRSMTKRMRIWRKRLAQEVLPKKTAKPLVRLQPQDDLTVVQQLRNLLSNTARANKFVEQLEVWDVDDDNNVSRKEFRRAFAVCFGYTASQNDLNTLFDEVDTNGNGEVDFDELHDAIERIQGGLAPLSTGGAAAKLAAKDEMTPEARREKHVAMLAAKDAKAKAIVPFAAPVRVLPTPRVAPPLVKQAADEPKTAPRASNVAPAAPPKPPQVVTWDPIALVSPAMMRASKALSPPVRRALSAISPAIARAAGVSELFEQVYAPTTPNTYKLRLDKWSALAAEEKKGGRPPVAVPQSQRVRESAPRAMRPPSAPRATRPVC